MSKETITLDYPISYADLRHLKEGDEVTITWRSAPELKSSATLAGEVKKTDIGTMHVHVDAPWVSTVGLIWSTAGTLGVAGTINRPDINVTIPKPEPLHAVAGAVLLGPGGKVAVGMAGGFDGSLELQPQWSVVYPHTGRIEYMSHEDSWVLRSWKRLHPLEVGPVEDEDDLYLDLL